MADYPFKLKIHKLKDGTLAAEVIAEGVIDISHRLIEVMNTFLARYAFVIINLGQNSALSYNIEKTFKFLKNKNKLIIIAEKDKQLGFYTEGITRFSKVESALKIIDGNYSVLQTILNFGELPIFNQSVFRILKILADPLVAFERLEKILRNEDKIARELINCANTMKTEVDGERVYTDVKSILSYQGLEGIRLLLLEDAFKLFEQMFALQSSDKITHMRYCMYLTGRVGMMLGEDKRTVRKMRVAGLFHDLGALFIRHIFSVQYSQVNELILQGADVISAEQKILGITHQEIGEIMGYVIGLPDYIVSSIAHHHKNDVLKDDLFLSTTISCNGYLNSEIEGQSNITPYDERLKVLDKEYIKITTEKHLNGTGKKTIFDLDRDENDKFEIVSPFEKSTFKQEMHNEYMAANRMISKL